MMNKGPANYTGNMPTGIYERLKTDGDSMLAAFV